MGKIVVAARIEVDDYVDFENRVSTMKPKRNVSQRIRELILQDIRKGAKK